MGTHWCVALPSLVNARIYPKQILLVYLLHLTGYSLIHALYFSVFVYHIFRFHLRDSVYERKKGEATALSWL